MPRPPRRLFFAGALLIAGCASATAVSLASLQFIAKDGIPLGCIVAYNKPLLGCSDDDFGAGNTCSSLCVRSLEKVTETLASSCGAADPADGSLLELAVSGELVDALCPGAGGDDGDDDDGDDDDDETSTTTSPRVTTTTSDSTTFIFPTSTTDGNGNGGGFVGTVTSNAPGSTETAGNNTGEGDNDNDDNGDEDFPGGAGGGSPFDSITSDGPHSISNYSSGWRAAIALAAAMAAGMLAL